jgi:RpiR family carbohydrate utilization transcriptional regulator
VSEAIAALSKARRVEFYGQGNSGIVAQDAENKFFRLGVATRSCSDPNIHAMAASLLGADAVVVAISASGQTVDILRSAQIARAAGARTIAITVAGSPLAQACDITLGADVPEDFNIYAPMTSRLAHLTIVDLLAVGVAVGRGPTLAPKLRRAKEVVAERRRAA